MKHPISCAVVSYSNESSEELVNSCYANIFEARFG